MIDSILGRIRRHIIPESVFNFFNPAYHWVLAVSGAILYRFPSRKLKVIGVTGTKGKSSTVEILSAILEEAGYKTALTNTIRFKIGNESKENLYKMSMPGRFFIQSFIRKAADAHCDYLILEMTSQGAITHRHRFIQLDAFVFTNISPEHIEAHGSYENYRQAKLDLCKSLSNSKKKNRALIVNADDKESAAFLECGADKKITYSLKDAEPYEIKKEGIDFTFGGKRAHSPLSGTFNLYNILAAASAARSQGVSDETIVRAIGRFNGIAGRVQKIEAGPFSAGASKGKQDFTVIVDYAHTPDSLEKLYQVFQTSRKVCVLGGTGGGRDSWKRKEMGRIADQYCDEIILTDEDPYDEDPRQIVDGVAAGISSKTPTIVMDRREAIREALKKASAGDTVLITGKGTDPYIMGPNETKTPWSDARIAKEELEKLLKAE
jgi:UDP-N-acetylmuramoyl-L-alanyl-D-glutamate--2,6-diaminopimelate ligase